MAAHDTHLTSYSRGSLLRLELIVPDNFPRVRIENCAVTLGRRALNIGAHRQLGVHINQIVVLIVGMVGLVNSLNGVTVVVKLNDVVVEDDEPIAEQTLGYLRDDKRVKLRRWPRICHDR